MSAETFRFDSRRLEKEKRVFSDSSYDPKNKAGLLRPYDF